MGRKVGKRGAVVGLQRRAIVAGRRDIEAADAAVLEWRCGIVGGAIDRGLERRRCFGHIQPVVGRHVEQLGLPRVIHETECRVAVPADHLGV